MATASASPRAPAPSRGRTSGITAGLAAVTLLALALRLVTLSEQSYWLDESYTVHLVRLGLGPMLRAIPRTESTPPLYYVLAWAWTHVFGSGEYGLRSISALAGTGTVLVGGLIADRVAGARAALIAAALLAVSPFLVWFSQEARAYALASLLTAVALLCLLDHAEFGRGRPLAGWAGAAALALCTHYFTAFLIAPGAVWLLWTGRHRAPVRIAAAAVALVAAALVPLALAQQGTGHADYIANGALSRRILQVPKQLLMGYASPGQLLTGVLAAAAVAAGAGWPLVTRRPLRSTSARLILFTAASGVLLPIGLALIGLDFLNTRNLLPVLAPLTAIAAAGFAAPGARRWAPWCGVGVIAVFGAVVALVNTHPAYQRPDFRGAVQALGPATRDRVVLASPAFSLLPVQAYAPATRVLTSSAAVTEFDVILIAAEYAPTTPPGVLASLPTPPGFRRVDTVARQTYSLVRYRAAAPTPVSPTQVSAFALGPNRAVLVQGPPAHRIAP